MLERRPANLSGGELRRAAVTKAIVRSASVRLLDEPLSALDAPVRREIQRLLLDWHHKTPGTTIHVTHDGQVAMGVADRIAVMESGKIIQFAEPAEIYRQPASRHVASAISTQPMNYLAAALVDGKLGFENEAIRSQVHHSLTDAKVDVGIRASTFEFDASSSASQGGLAVTGRVQRVEQVDARRLVHLRCGQVTLVADAGTRPVNIDETLNLFVELNDLHLFDADTGIRV